MALSMTEREDILGLFLARAVRTIAADKLLSMDRGKSANHLHTVSLVVEDRNDSTALNDEPHFVLMNQVRSHAFPLSVLGLKIGCPSWTRP